MYSRNRRIETKAEINMTPVIDVMFQLVLFFMLTSTIIKTSSINVRLPKAVTVEAQPVQNIVVTITEKGQIYINDQIVEKSKIPTVIRSLLIKHPKAPILIRGDAYINYGLLVEIMDLIRIGGGKEISLVTEVKRTL